MQEKTIYKLTLLGRNKDIIWTRFYQSEEVLKRVWNNNHKRKINYGRTFKYERTSVVEWEELDLEELNKE